MFLAHPTIQSLLYLNVISVFLHILILAPFSYALSTLQLANQVLKNAFLNGVYKRGLINCRSNETGLKQKCYSYSLPREESRSGCPTEITPGSWDRRA